MKTIGLIGLLSLPLMVAYGMIAGTPGEAAQGLERPVSMPAPAAGGGNGKLPAGLSEYVFLHHARHESTPVHAMAGAAAICPD